MNRDPIDETGGSNLYGMVENNAVNRWDTLGLSPGSYTFPSSELEKSGCNICGKRVRRALEPGSSKIIDAVTRVCAYHEWVVLNDGTKIIAAGDDGNADHWTATKTKIHAKDCVAFNSCMKKKTAANGDYNRITNNCQAVSQWVSECKGMLGDNEK